MKSYFFESRDDLEIVLPSELLKKLPEKITLFTTVQHLEQVPKISKQLVDNNIVVNTEKLKHTKYPAQILGCSIKQVESDSDAFLYVGDGAFHPKALVLKNNKQVFAYNPYINKVKEYSEKDTSDLIKKRNGGLTKFHTSTEIGVIVTTKPGQNRLVRAKKLKDLYPDKNFYLLISDTIDFNGLQDFNYIECFINTACPRIGYDDSIKIHKPVINLEEIDNEEW